MRPWRRIVGVERDSSTADDSPGELEVRDVSVGFGGLRALEGVSLRAPSGSIVGVIGPNGAGKTTLFNAICGFITPDAGTVRWHGRSLEGIRPNRLARLRIARTLQGVGLFGHLTAVENVMVAAARRGRFGFWPALLGLPRSDADEARARHRAIEALEAVGVAEVADRPAASLPYPTQKRVALARALALGPRLLLLDEPAGGLGGDDVEALVELIRGFRGSMTVMCVEHHMDFVMSVCDEVVVLDSGQVVASGTPQTVQADPKVHEAYLGVVTEGQGSHDTGEAGPRDSMGSGA